MYASLHGKGDLTSLAFEFSPIVEQTAPDTVTLDASGLDRLFGLPQDVAAAIARRAADRGIQARLALASNPDAAICAARGFSGVNVVPYGDEAKFLGPLPLSILAPTPELAETLDRWGIRRFHEMAALPPLGIAERLGPEGLKLRELARGEAERKLVKLEDAPSFEDELELDYPIELLEPLAFVLSRLIHNLATRLATRALATDEIRLRMKLEPRANFERTLRLPVPSLDTKAFLKLMQLDLTAHPPPAPIIHVWMGVNPVKPQSAQSGLYVPTTPEPVKLELTLARVKAIVGENRVGVAEVLNTHRPDAFRMTNHSVTNRAATVRERSSERSAGLTRLALRIYRPPRIARVSLASGQPSYVSADGIRGKILEFAGPWRTSGDWWAADSWARDEWDVALSDGALYRLYCCANGWFVEGSYD